MGEYKIQEINPAVLPPEDQIPGITVPKVNYGTSIGGKDKPEDGATNNSAQIVNGQVIVDLVNSKLNTSTKQILDGFTFGASGAIQMITDVNNGLWISPTGILAKKAGVTTFTLDTAGNATFKGSILSGSTIAAPTITGGTITGATLQTASSGQRVVLDSNNYISLYSSYSGGTFAGSVYGLSFGGNQGIAMDGSSVLGLLINGTTVAYANTSGFSMSSGYNLYTNDIFPNTSYNSLGGSSSLFQNIFATNYYVGSGSNYFNYYNSRFQFSNGIYAGGDTTASGSLVASGGLYTNSTDTNTTNGWRIVKNPGNNDLLIQRNVSGSWTTKQTITG